MNQPADLKTQTKPTNHPTNQTKEKQTKTKTHTHTNNQQTNQPTSLVFWFFLTVPLSRWLCQRFSNWPNLNQETENNQATNYSSNMECVYGSLQVLDFNLGKCQILHTKSAKATG